MTHAEVTRENDALILDRLLAMLHELPRREREAVLAGASFKEEADRLQRALEATPLLRLPPATYNLPDIEAVGIYLYPWQLRKLRDAAGPGASTSLEPGDSSEQYQEKGAGRAQQTSAPTTAGPKGSDADA